MKLEDHFNTFLSDVVNLNDTRLGLLDDSIDALKDVIRQSDWTPKIKRFVPQGSWAHKTIIKPVAGNPFDADLLVFVAPVDGWQAKDYVNTLHGVFAKHTIYKEKVRRYSHCLTIEYAGVRKIDIAPCVIDRIYSPTFEVCNRNSNGFEASEPEGYTQWLITRNGWAGSNGLRKVTRLLKYLRDVKRNFTCPSVLFTTLLGERLTIMDSFNTREFADVPTSLKTIVDRLDDWLQNNASRPVVKNPELDTEILSDLWDDTQYKNFRDKMHKYRGWIDDAYDEPDRDESIGKWRRVFGDDFAKSVTIEKATQVSQEAQVLAEAKSLTRPSFVRDLVSLFSEFGRRVLPANFHRLPHMQRPTWRTSLQFQASIYATRHLGRGGVLVAEVASGDGPLPKHHWLRFQARAANGIPLAGDYEVHWRVTNTDRAASQAGCLRGTFVAPNDGASRWEQLSYRGVHTVDAFVVRVRDQVLVAQSEPFYVVID